LLRGAVSTVPSTNRALQPEQNVRNIVEWFRDFCRLINRSNSALGASVDRFVTHFLVLVFCFKKPRRSVTLKTRPDRAPPIRRGIVALGGQSSVTNATSPRVFAASALAKRLKIAVFSVLNGLPKSRSFAAAAHFSKEGF